MLNRTITNRSPHPIHWDLVNAGRFDAYAADWDALNDAGPRNPFLASTFMRALLEHFVEPGVRLAMGRRSGSTVAMLLVRPINRFTWACYQPSQLMVAPLVKHDDLALPLLLDGLFAVLPGRPLIVSVTQLDPMLMARPAEGPRTGTLDYIETCQIELPSGPFSHYEEGLSTKLKSNLRRRQRTATRDIGEVSLAVYTAQEEVAPFLRRYAAMESAGWKGRSGTALEEGNAQFHFYLDLLQRFAAQGALRMFELRFGDRATALDILLLGPRMALRLKTTHDETLRSHGPGQLLFHEILRWLHAHEPQIRQVETYGRITDKQRAFATSTRWMYHINVYRHTAVAAAHRWRMRSAQQRSGDAAPPSAPLPSLTGAAAFFGSRQWYQLLRDTVDMPGRYVEATSTAEVALPLLVTRGFLGTTVAGTCDSFYSCPFAPVLEPGASTEHLRQALFSVLDETPWDILRLAPLAPDAPVTAALRTALQQRGIPHDSYFCFINWYLPVRWQTFADYLASRPSRLQNTIRRAQKRFGRDPAARFEIVRTPGPALEEAIEKFLLLYRKRGRKAEPYPDFIPELCRRTAAAGQLRLGILSFGGTPAAAQVWIVHADTALIFKLAYDPERRNLSAGTLLSARMMQNAVEDDRVREIDYLIGNDAYKKDWMTHSRERVGIVAFNPRSARGIAAATRHFAGRLARRLQNRLASHGDAAAPAGDTCGKQLL